MNDNEIWKNREPWIQSFTGKKVTILDLKPEQVCIEDIAHALSNKGRYTGHAKFFYSVAQHCVLGARQAPAYLKLAFLLHELSEVYLPDIAGPLKPYVFLEDDPDFGCPWAQFEKRHTKVMLEALGYTSLEPLIYSPEIREIDLRMLVTEKETLHPGAPPEPWGMEDKFPAFPAVGIEQWTNEEAEAEWNVFFRELTK